MDNSYRYSLLGTGSGSLIEINKRAAETAEQDHSTCKYVQDRLPLHFPQSKSLVAHWRTRD